MNEILSDLLWVALWQVIFAGFMLVIVGIIIYHIHRRQKWIDNMSDAELKRWEQYRKYCKSGGRELKGLILVICTIGIPMVAMIFFGINTVMLSMSIIFIPLLIVVARFAFKTRNRDELIMFITVLLMFIGVGLQGLGKSYGMLVMWCGLMILWVQTLFNLRTEKRHLRLFNNLVVTAGYEIDSHLDGYSQRPFSKESAAIKNVVCSNFRKIADDFGKSMGKELIFVDWKINEKEAVFYPLVAPIKQYLLMFQSLRKSKLSWVRVNSEGEITVFVSKQDYDRIAGEVTYHLLCRNIAEKFEESFIEFAKGDKENAIKILRGDKNG